MEERTWEQKLADIVTMEPAALTAGDIEFLRARRDYLSEADRVKFAEILPKADASDDDDIDEDAGKSLEEHSDKELAKVAKSVGLKTKDFETREQLIEAIRAKQSEQQ